MQTVVQLTDAHLSVHERMPQGIDTWGNFEWALQSAQQYRPDLLIVTGDLSLDRGDAATYAQIAALLKAQPSDWIVLPGNHDDPALFAAAFGRRYQRGTDVASLDGIVDLEGLPMIVVDTSSGALTDQQLAWFDAVLFDAADRFRRHGVPPIVWMHHPPRTGMHRFMDRRYPLRNHEQVWHCLRAAKVPIWVFCGHYHMDYNGTHDGVQLCIAPALYRQFDPTTTDLRVDDPAPGFRVVHIDQTAREFSMRVQSTVVRRAQQGEEE